MKRSLSGLLALSMFLGLSLTPAAAQTETEIKARFTHGSHTWQQITILYRLFSPEGYSEDQLYPLVLALHGGWGGTDNFEQLSWRAATSWADTVNQNRHPAFVVAPRAPENTTLFFPEIQDVVMSLVDMLLSRLPLDPDRIYVTGYSNGGIATFRLLENHPDRFAAAIPMSGWGRPHLVSTWAHVPVWSFHGRLDDVIPPHTTQVIFQNLDDMGLKPVYTHCGPDGDCFAIDDCVLDGFLRYRHHLFTEFRDESHVMWLLAYNDQRMIDWTYRQRRRSPGDETPLFDVSLDVDMTFELDDPDAVNVVGSHHPLSDPEPLPLCDPDGDEIYSATVAFEESLLGAQLTYRFSHTGSDGTTIEESLSEPRSIWLAESRLPIVFWNNANETVPSPPNLLFPEDGGLAASRTDLEWSPGEVGGRFDVQVGRDSEFGEVVREFSEIDDRSVTVEDLDTLATYHWRVRASNVVGAGEWASAQFATLGSSPLLIEPVDGAVVSTEVTLQWTSYPDANRYYLQISETPDFVGVTTLRLSRTEYQPTDLSEGIHYWRVKANASLSFSPVWSFEVSSSTGIADRQNAPQETSLADNYPNPFRTTTTIPYELARPGFVALTVTDLLGRQVIRLFSGEQHAGKHEVKLNATSLPAGIYFYRLESEESVETRSMVVLR